MSEAAVLRFNEVSFEHQYKKPLLEEASFTVRESSKITLMGQNGAGKSTLFSLITGDLKPKSGGIFIPDGTTIAIGRQTMAREDLNLTVGEYFAKAFQEIPPDLGRHINRVLEAVNFSISACSNSSLARWATWAASSLLILIFSNESPLEHQCRSVLVYIVSSPLSRRRTRSNSWGVSTSTESCGVTTTLIR